MQQKHLYFCVLKHKNEQIELLEMCADFVVVDGFSRIGLTLQRHRLQITLEAGIFSFLAGALLNHPVSFPLRIPAVSPRDSNLFFRLCPNH